MRQTQKTEQKQKMNALQKHSLRILSMSAPDLDDFLEARYDANPLLYREERAGRQPEDYREAPDPIESLLSDPADALEDVTLQLHACHLDARAQRTGDYLIGMLDRRGYLSDGYEMAMEECDVSESELELLVGYLQDMMDPPGLFARDLQECLLIQVRRKEPAEPLLEELLEEHFESLALGDLEGIALAMDRTEDEVRTMIERVRQLEPNPLNGAPERTPIQYKIPELEVRASGNELEILLIDRGDTVSINPYYVSARKEGALSKEEREQMRGYYDEARQLIYALSQRKKTLLRVATTLLQAQKWNLLAGQPLVGMTESDLAEELQVSVSTVSRTLRDKYYLYEGEVRPLRELLSPKLRSGISRDELQFLIASLIASENKASPLSDAAIARYCTVNGHKIARRTIAKYREELQIPPLEQRRKLA